MMHPWQAVLEVARWEFLRFVKPRQQLAAMLLTFVVAGGAMTIGRLARRDGDRVREIAVVGTDNLPLPTSAGSFRFVTHTPEEVDALRTQVRDRLLDGLLIIHDPDRAALMLATGGGWTDELQLVLAAARQQYMTERAGLSADALASILMPPQIEITYEVQRVRGRGERVALIVVVSLMLLAVFIGMNYIFASITGEKQIRVTEQVISAIPAQAWIDGKILGLIGVSIIGVVGQVIAFAAVFEVVRRFFGGGPLPLPESLGDPAVLALIVIYALLGLFFWFAFLGAVAAMIDDPNNSTRGSLLFVPLAANGLAFVILNDAETALARLLSLLPPTSPAAMPVRLLTVDVGTAEILLSIGLLLGGALVLRIAAGRVFRLAMLMYGKEPTWSEVRRWALRG